MNQDLSLLSLLSMGTLPKPVTTGVGRQLPADGQKSTDTRDFESLLSSSATPASATVSNSAITGRPQLEFDISESIPPAAICVELTQSVNLIGVSGPQSNLSPAQESASETISGTLTIPANLGSVELSEFAQLFGVGLGRGVALFAADGAPAASELTGSSVDSKGTAEAQNLQLMPATPGSEPGQTFVPALLESTDAEVSGGRGRAILLLPLDANTRAATGSTDALLINQGGVKDLSVAAAPNTASFRSPESSDLIPVKLEVTPGLVQQLTRIQESIARGTIGDQLPADATTQKAVADTLLATGQQVSADKSLDSLLRNPALQVQTIAVKVEFATEQRSAWLEAAGFKPENQAGQVAAEDGILESSRQRGGSDPGVRNQPTIIPTPEPGTQQSPPGSNQAAPTIFDSIELKDSAALRHGLQQQVDGLPTSSMDGATQMQPHDTGARAAIGSTPTALGLAEPTDFKVEFDRMHIEALLQRGEVKLRLNPPELGSMRIEISTTGDEVTAKLRTTSESARKVVELHLPQLRENFTKAGVRVDHIEVTVDCDAEKRGRFTGTEKKVLPQRSNQRSGEVAQASSAYPIAAVLGGGHLNILA